MGRDCLAVTGRAALLAAALGSVPMALGQHHGDFPHHVVGVFVGDTTEHRRDNATLGLEYEYRMNPAFGLGVTAERVWGDVDADVFVVPVAYHRGPWKLYTGPGIEMGDEHDEELWRIGAEYGFHLGEFEISPQVDLDFVDGEELFIFGVVFARSF